MFCIDVGMMLTMWFEGITKISPVHNYMGTYDQEYY